ncbi:S1 family peptidase [Streptomyces sp. NBC_00158]|uniref:S1 family peptidase n=1 Tax=Streptomyces sp. NBC_00158 TaxID=2903627 RepID=UPI003253C09F
MKVRRKVLLGSAVTALLAGLALAPGATPSSAQGSLGLPAPSTPQTAARALAGPLGMPEREVARRLDAQGALADTGTSFTHSQGATAAGVWLDVMRGEVHANVVDEAGESAAKAAGIIPHRAEYTTAALKEVHGRLDAASREGRMPRDSSWGVDERTDRVRLEIPESVNGETLLREAGVTTEDRGKVTVTTHRGTSVRQTSLVGGDGLNDPGGMNCSAGFMLQRGGDAYLTTAGHCWGVGTPLRRSNGTRDGQGRELIGTVSERHYPVADYALIKVDNPRDWVPSGRAVRTSQWSYNLYNGYIDNPDAQMRTGLYTCASGWVSGWSCGTYVGSGWSTTNPDGTTTYGQILVSGLNSTFGDSGGAVLYGDKGVGTVNGDLNTGGQKFIRVQPLATIIRNSLGALRVVDWNS